MSERSSPVRPLSVERPRKRGRPLSYEEKWMVYQVFEALEHERAETAMVGTLDSYSRTSKYTGVARSRVARIAKSVRDTGTVPPASAAGNRKPKPTAIPASAEGTIRAFIFERHRQGAVCSAMHIGALLKSEFGLEVPERTVQRHLQRMGFGWSRTKHRPRSLREKDAVRQQRHDYLYELRRNRQRPLAQRSPVVYLDESFLHHHHAAQFSWFAEDDFLERASGKGRRWCFIHAMLEDRLVEGALLIFEAKKASGDYHQQFNFERFQHWFQEQLLPNLPAHCLIVLDRCPYHLVADDSIIPHQMRKLQLQQWLSAQGIPWQEQWLRPRLVEEVDRHRDKTPKIQTLAENQGHQVLFLPVHHPELNPIELVWATAKNYCAAVFSNDIGFSEQRQHLQEALNTHITPAYCAEVYEHVRQQEDEYWEADLVIDDVADSGRNDSALLLASGDQEMGLS
jgi:transposase